MAMRGSRKEEVNIGKECAEVASLVWNLVVSEVCLVPFCLSIPKQGGGVWGRGGCHGN